MSMDFGEGDYLDASTMRGQDWPCLRQVCVLLENRVGQLRDLLQHLEGQDLRLVALSIVDSVDFAVVRVLLDNYERARELFELSDFTYFENDLIGVELPDAMQPYVAVCTALLQAELNVHYTYPLLFRRRGKAAIALFVDDIDQALEVLKEKGLTIITENDLLDDDEYFRS